MAGFLASPNSRYFACINEGQLIVARSGSVVGNRRLGQDYSPLALSDQGNLLTVSPDGLELLDVSWAASSVVRSLDAWSRGTLVDSGSNLGVVALSSDARLLCVERISQNTKSGRSLFGFGGKRGEDAAAQVHELYFCHSQDGTNTLFYSAICPPKHPSPFRWAIAPGFGWVVTAEPQKKDETKVQIVHVDSKTIYHDFAFSKVEILHLSVDNEGTIMLTLKRDDMRMILVVTIDGVRRDVTVPTDFQVVGQGKDYVAMITRPVPYLLMKGFDDDLLRQVDLRGLTVPGLSYMLHFSAQDTIDLLVYKDDMFTVVHSRPEMIDNDVRAWDAGAGVYGDETRRFAQTPSRRPAPFDPSGGRTPGQGAPWASGISYDEPATSPPAYDPPALIPPVQEDSPAPIVPSAAPLDAAPATLDRARASELMRSSALSKKTLGAASKTASPSEQAPPLPLATSLESAPASPDPTPAPSSGRLDRLTLGRRPSRLQVDASSAAHPSPSSVPAPDSDWEEQRPAPLPLNLPRGQATARVFPTINAGGQVVGGGERGASERPSPSSPQAPPAGERARLEGLLELLEERFITGQVSEASYRELRDKYLERMRAL